MNTNGETPSNQEHIYLPGKFYFDYGYIMLPIEGGDDLATQINIDGSEFFLKPKLHVSVAPVKRYVRELVARGEKDPEQNILQAFRDIDPKLIFNGFTDDIRIVEENLPGREPHKPIVIFCNVDGMEELAEQLSEKLGIEVFEQPAHVTLYAINDWGIGLVNQEEVNRLTRLPSSEELAGLQALIKNSTLSTAKQDW